MHVPVSPPPPVRALAVRSSRAGFTLIELLIVVGIIGILMALIIPTTRAIRETARRTKCTHNLHGIYQAMLDYTEDYRGLLPNCTVLNFPPTYPRQLHNLLRPYLEEADPYDFTKNVQVFICPSADNINEDLLTRFGSTYQVRGPEFTRNKFPFSGQPVDYYPNPGELGLIRDARGWHRLNPHGSWTLATTMGQQVLFLDGHVQYFGDVDRHAGGIW